MFLLFLIIGCSNSSSIVDSQENSKPQSVINIESYMETFNKSFNEKDIEIKSKYFSDLDNDNVEELIILFDDLSKEIYTNVAILSREGIYYLHLDSQNKLRFVTPIDSELKIKPFEKPEVRVSLRDIETQKQDNYYISLERKSVDNEKRLFIIVSNDSSHK